MTTALEECMTNAAKGMLKVARQNAHVTNRPGVARQGCVVVIAHRYNGPWTYEVGTDAMLSVTGSPKDVLPILESLLAEYT